MAFRDTLKYIKMDELTPDEKTKLKEVLLNHKRILQARLKSIDRELEKLSKK